MMPLTLAAVGEENRIKKVGGKAWLRGGRECDGDFGAGRKCNRQRQGSQGGGQQGNGTENYDLIV